MINVCNPSSGACRLLWTEKGHKILNILFITLHNSYLDELFISFPAWNLNVRSNFSRFIFKSICVNPQLLHCSIHRKPRLRECLSDQWWRFGAHTSVTSYRDILMNPTVFGFCNGIFDFLSILFKNISDAMISILLYI